MALSKVRLDPIEGVFSMRGYPHPVDPSLPLEKESAKYHTVATVTISGYVAAATLTNGDLSDLGMWADIDSVLRERNVTELHYDRHKGGEVIPKIRYIRPMVKK